MLAIRNSAYPVSFGERQALRGVSSRYDGGAERDLMLSGIDKLQRGRLAASPCSVMCSASAPLSSSRRQTGRGALGRNFFDQVLAQQLAEHLAGRAALELGVNFNGAVLALRGGRKQHQLGIIGILHSVATASRAVTTEAPQWP